MVESDSKLAAELDGQSSYRVCAARSTAFASAVRSRIAAAGLPLQRGPVPSGRGVYVGSYR